MESVSNRSPQARREVLLRVSRLADDLPEVSELELTPAGARIRVAPYVAQDPFLRRLRLNESGVMMGELG
jgi:hypothetical protein